MQNNESPPFDIKFKVLLVGESTVGKTSIIRSLTGKQFMPNLMSTIGIDFDKRVYDIQGKKVMLEIWDTAGQERFYSITRYHYRDTKGIILVYDVTNQESLEKIQSYWLKSVDQALDDPVPVFLVGNKIDLKEQRLVTEADGRRIHDQQYAHGFFETSAKKGTNVEELFTSVAEILSSVYGLPKCFYEEMRNGVPTTPPLDMAWRPRVVDKKKPKKKKKSILNVGPPRRTSIKLHTKPTSSQGQCSCSRTG